MVQKRIRTARILCVSPPTSYWYSTVFAVLLVLNTVHSKLGKLLIERLEHPVLVPVSRARTPATPPNPLHYRCTLYRSPLGSPPNPVPIHTLPREQFLGMVCALSRDRTTSASARTGWRKFCATASGWCSSQDGAARGGLHSMLLTMRHIFRGRHRSDGAIAAQRARGQEAAR